MGKLREGKRVTRGTLRPPKKLKGAPLSGTARPSMLNPAAWVQGRSQAAGLSELEKRVHRYEHRREGKVADDYRILMRSAAANSGDAAGDLRKSLLF
jgi:hypothetical protein